MLDSTFEVLYLAGFVLGSVIRAVYARPRRRRSIAADRRTRLDTALLSFASLGLILPLVCVLSPWLDFADYGLPAWAGWAGAAVFAGALWLLWRSHVDLGRHWAPVLQIRDEQPLVTRGVYGHIRHPMYAAHWLWGIAQALLLWNWLAGPAMLVTFLPLYLVRVPREERMMRDHFGDEYRSHVKRTGRIIPRLWG